MDAGTFRITYADGRTKDLAVKPMLSDLVTLERKYSISAQQISEPNAPLEWIAFLIWQVEQRNGEGRPFEEWLATVADLEPPEADAAVPTADKTLEPQPA